MAIETRHWESIVIPRNLSAIIPATFGIQITHTGTTGTLTVSNVGVSGVGYTNILQAGETFNINPSSIANASMRVFCADGATGKVIYWRAE